MISAAGAAAGAAAGGGRDRRGTGPAGDGDRAGTEQGDGGDGGGRSAAQVLNTKRLFMETEPAGPTGDGAQRKC
jgi:hypothetical protein